MSICDLDKIDGMAMTIDKRGLALFLSDHMDWEEELIHLEILQDKINLYANYFEDKDYKNINKYKTYDFEYAIIDLYFKYSLPENAVKFIDSVNNKLRGINMRINCHISE